MKRLSTVFVSAFVFPLLLSPAAFAEKKTPEQYWAGTGVSRDFLLKNYRVFKTLNCISAIENFRGCVAALNAIAAQADPMLKLIPSSMVEPGSLVQSYGEFSLVKETEEKPSRGEAFKETWERQEAKRRSIEAGVDALFMSSNADFEAIYKDIFPRALTTPDKEALLAGSALSAYVTQTVDAHARVQPREEVADEMADGDDSFVGIGAVIEIINKQTVITALTEGSPALKAGIKANDIILRVDNTDAPGMNLTALIKLIRGQENTVVNMTIMRNGKEMLIPIVRAPIHQENVESKVVRHFGKDVGVIRLHKFTEELGCDKIRDKIKELTAENVKGLVLDLRGNGGGLLQQAQCIGALFLGKQTIVQVKNLESNEMTKIDGEKNAITKLPMVTLIDGGSASASEIVAGALRDHEASWIVGERSFGKGSVQQQFPYLLNSMVMYRTIQRFYQPNGSTNQVVGISPDVEAPSRPGMSVNERFVLREPDVFPTGLAATGEEWKPLREGDVQKLNACVSSEGLAKAKYQKDSSLDYQVLVAEEVLHCVHYKNKKH